MNYIVSIVMLFLCCFPQRMSGTIDSYCKQHNYGVRAFAHPEDQPANLRTFVTDKHHNHEECEPSALQNYTKNH